MFNESEHPFRVNAALWDAVVEALRARGVEASLVWDDTRGTFATLTARGHRREYAVEARQQVTRAALGTIQPSRSAPTLLVAPHVTRAMAEHSKELGIEFVDAAGNMFLDLPAALIDVEGRRADRDSLLSRADRIFQPSGLKLCFALLCAPALVEAPLRTLADEARVSLGSAHALLSGLQDAGYVEDRGRTRRLHQTRRLLDRWTEAYDTNLRARLSLGEFDTDDPEPWLAGDVPVTEHGAQWGGETAAALIDGFLRPGAAVVYVDHSPRELVQQFRLRRAKGPGVVRFRERFWGDAAAATARWPWCVPTPLVYADLVGSAEPRQVEAARRLRERDDVLRRIDAG